MDQLTLQQEGFVDQAMNIARKLLLANYPFEAHLFLQTPLIRIDDSEACPTMQTNGEDIQWNPQFVLQQFGTQVTGGPGNEGCAKIVGVLRHELKHISLLHVTRRGSRELEDWNIACDYAINGDLKRGGASLPDDIYIDEKYTGRSPEDIFREIYNKNKPKAGSNGQSGNNPSNSTPNSNPSNNPSNNSGQNPQQNNSNNTPNSQVNPGQSGQNSGPSNSSNNPTNNIPNNFHNKKNFGGILPQKSGQTADIIKDKIERATVATTMAGLGKTLDKIEIRKPYAANVAFEEILNKVCTEVTNADYSFRRPNRSFSESEFIMPSLYSKSLGNLVLACDVSASVLREEVEKTVNQTLGVLQLYADKGLSPTLTVIYFADGITKIEHLNVGDTPNPEGSGGTDVKEILEYVSENHSPGLVCMTDGGFYNFHTDPGCPVFWGIVRKDEVNGFEKRAEFGATFYLDLNG